MSQPLTMMILFIGLLGGFFSLAMLATSGSGDTPVAYVGYLQTCAILIGAATIAAAIRERGNTDR